MSKQLDKHQGASFSYLLYLIFDLLEVLKVTGSPTVEHRLRYSLVSESITGMERA